MQPVVNGLEEMYANDIEFRHIDANSAEGRPLFRQFNLQGHPSYVLVNPTGDVLWQSLGEQPESVLEEALSGAIDK